MPSASQFKSNRLVKLLLLGESGSGKTGGSIAPLAAAGYKVRVLEYDNGVDSAVDALARTAPDKLSNIDYMPLRDKRKSSAGGPIFDGVPTAFVDGMRLLDNWDPSLCSGIDPDYKNDPKLGKPGEWGPESVIVIDSLTYLADAVHNYYIAMNPNVGSKGGPDPRQVFYMAQRGVEQILALLTSDSFNTNVIVIAHIDYQERGDGSMKGLPKAVGTAFGPKIPSYFHTMCMAERILGSTPPKYQIRTLPTNLLDLKNPASTAMPGTLPIESGMADIFKKLKGN